MDAWRWAVLGVTVVTNIAAFAAFGVDKRRARRKAWRVPERTLLALSAAMGALGALAGMKVFHHKTQKIRFVALVPIMLAAQAGLLIWIILG